MAGQAPIVASIEPADVQRVLGYMDDLRRSNTDAAAAEAQRLQEYFSALSKQFTADAGKPLPDFNSDMMPRESLVRLFNAIAAHTHNTILSEFVIGPAALLRRKDTLKDNKRFASTIAYGGKSFSIGFIQVFGSNRDGSVSIPILCLDNAVLSTLNRHQSEPMLRALQYVATAGNHDMLHHYTNTVLTNSIATSIKDDSLPESPLSPKDWWRKNFHHQQDSDPSSYEGWLMMNHSRIRLRMAEEDGDALQENCDLFFDELARIGQEIAERSNAAQAHDAVDYLGTVLLYTMMRFMPVSHPLFQHAVQRLQQADPAPDIITEAGESILAQATGNKDTDILYNDAPVIQTVLENYKAQGVDLLSAHPSYADLKTLQVIEITPWIAHFMSPAPAQTHMGDMQERVSALNVEMLEDTAWSVWLNNIKDGKHTLELSNGETATVYTKDGALHRKDGPALTKCDAEGTLLKEEWYENGAKTDPKAPASKARIRAPSV